MFEIINNKMILLIGVVIAIIFILNYKQKEGFIDPYPIVLHNEILPKHEWWDLTHRKGFFYNRYGTLQSDRE